MLELVLTHSPPFCTPSCLRGPDARRARAGRQPRAARRSGLGVADRRRGDVVERRPDLGRQRQVLGRQRPAQLRRRTRADDRRRDARAVAHPGQRHLERGWPEPVGRGRDGVDDAPGAVVEELLDERARSAARRRGESAGMPPRYLPVSTPRPSGDQGSRPRPSACAAGSTSRSMPRCSSEYSTCVDDDRCATRPRLLPGRGPAGLPAGVVGDADVARPAGGDGRVERGQRLVERRRRRSRCAPATGRRGRCRAAAATRRARRAARAREVSTDALARCVGRCRPWSRARPRRGRRPSRAASRAPAPPRRRRTPPAVSTSVPPASRKALSWSPASCSSVSRPQVIVPRPSRRHRQARTGRARVAPCGRSYRGGVPRQRRRRTGSTG